MATAGAATIESLFDAATVAVELLEPDVRESVPREKWDDVIAGVCALFLETGRIVAEDPEAMRVGLLLRKLNPQALGNMH